MISSRRRSSHSGRTARCELIAEDFVEGIVFSIETGSSAGGHQDLVVNSGRLCFRGMDFMAIGDESQAAVELLGRLVFADHGQLDELDPFAGMGEEPPGRVVARRRRPARQAERTCPRDGPCGPAWRRLARGNRPYRQDRLLRKAPKTSAIRRLFFELSQRSRALLLERAAEGLPASVAALRAGFPGTGARRLRSSGGLGLGTDRSWRRPQYAMPDHA